MSQTIPVGASVCCAIFAGWNEGSPDADGRGARSLARMDQHKPPQRSSLADLVAALVVTLLVGLYLLLITAFSVTLTSGHRQPGRERRVRCDHLRRPGRGVVVLAAFVITRWRRGWTAVWKAPMIVLIGGLFWPALFLLISRSVRRGLLPTRPGHDGTCSACGVTLMADALFCQSCGSPQPRRLGHRALSADMSCRTVRRWCPGCGAAVLGAAPGAAEASPASPPPAYIVGFFAAFAAIVWSADLPGRG